jgi:hypothetical protein
MIFECKEGPLVLHSDKVSSGGKYKVPQALYESFAGFCFG